MNADWPLISLAKLYEISSGLSKPAKDFGSGYPFLSFKDVFYNFFVPDTLTELVQTNERERESCSIQRGDVFLTRTSETINELGMSCVALKDYEHATFNGFTKRLRPKSGTDLLPEYVGYYLRSPSFRKAMMAFSTLMSTRASLNNEMIGRLRLLVPPRKEQVKIAHVLKTLDKKIELNCQINQILEEMAQAIFKSWFVYFEPVKAKIKAKANGQDPERAAICAISGKTEEELNQLTTDQLAQLRATAALFPGELTDSELGLIPKGWDYVQFGDVVEIFDSKRVPLSKGQREKRKGPYPYYGAASVMDYVDAFLFDGTYVLMAEDGSVMDGNGYPTIQYVWGKFWVNNHAHILKGANGVSDENILLFLKNTVVAPYVTGAVQLKINQKNMKMVPFLKAPDDVHQSFGAVIQPLFEGGKQRTDESQVLTELRDLLLPKLLSGSLEIRG